jgi:signal peptidase complex subunit 3
LKADLSPLFNWNVKALYLYLTAEYITETNTLNEMVLWDKIILNGEKMELDLKAAKTKYYFRNDGKGLLNHNNITLILNWNVQPNMGDLKWVKSKSTHSFEFPGETSNTKKRKN